ncbi:MAG: asparagine synthase (glutamine-hydrolyzing), partial [Candidatus Riflebacteria bacterium]|nr:asparagine synthase (glutamine-hydrolyzing) [Candidatus Riflebacteria bacterium]
MCGIAGFLLPRHGPAPEPWLLAGMIRQLAHRGPDGEGTWSSPDGRVGLGHRLLAIVDPTPAARQPMVSPSGRFVLSWNGELYNAPDWRAAFERDGERFRSRSDAEVFLQAVETWGLDTALERATGMYAFALWDGRDGVLHLGRDRFGEKPLYYGHWQGGWYFASELKAFLPLAGWPPPLDEPALRQYLAYGRIDSPACVFQGFAKLPPGTTLSLPWAVAGSPSAPPPRRYWQAPARSPAAGFRLSDGEVLERTRELLERSVQMRLAARVPVGAFLSGGIDSSLLTALAVRHAGPGFRTYAIGFADPAFDESEQAAAVARHLGTTHRTVMLGPRELAEAVSALPETFDEPFADSSQVPQMVLAALARQEVTVCLSGDGADELFGGYTRHLQGPATAALIGRLPRGARALLRRCLLVPSVGAWEPLSRLASWLGIGGGGWRYLGLKVQRLAEAFQADSPEGLYRHLVGLGLPGSVAGGP